MKIVNHLLCMDDGTPCAFAKSPNQGGAITPRYLVIHFTASHSAKVAIDWLTNPEAKASAHVVREGDWCRVDVLQPVNGHAELHGWVHGNYLERIS